MPPGLRSLSTFTNTATKLEHFLGLAFRRVRRQLGHLAFTPLRIRELRSRGTELNTEKRTITTMPPPQPRTHKAKPPSPEPRPSSSILLISPENKILLLHRVKTSSSFASAHVFPGGNLSSQDGPIPAPSSPERHVDSPVYRLGAIRECFEESGILLARHRDGGGMLEVPDAERERARRAIHSGELKFGEWVKEMGGVVDADALLPFTRWITPTSVPRRFTTQMYVYFWPLPGAGQDAKIPIGGDAMIPTPTSDGGLEHTAAVFQSCATWLEQARRNEIIMFPPQLYLIWLLGKFFEGGKGGAMDLREQREKANEFLKGSGANGVPWADKVISPVPLGMFEGRAVLSLDHPGPELKGSGRRGESGHVVQVRFSKEGPRDAEVRDAVEMKKLMGEAKGKL
ncbi:hypothetical protein VC83_09353 [Pseudogymnoascus destructans]|uniref:Nudix hydrolase domain-containing protein n=1 Tax=Pseudogymnoascus destructans TaxID=655981 RepID=A0A176ZZ40_9PEZI|nr:uncharacterized protein VC83_09353 [Pseudogymnoascus destructans]OAF54301.1 hypothetical protein VC83_09353 [Pseudogymnoascus destructans]